MENILQTITKVRPHLTLCQIDRNNKKAYGFNLSRSDCDPYPWISNVAESSPAAESGLAVGDFVIEVNGEDVLGLNIEEVSQRVWTMSDAVRLLVWKSVIDDDDKTENNNKKLKQVFNRQKLCDFIQNSMQLIECPVCLDVKLSPSPLYQCVNGHILCSRCRPNTDKCPMCRVPLSGKGRCLVGEKLHELIISSLNLKFSPQKIVHQKVHDIRKKTGNSEPSLFHCPWSEPCNARIVGEQSVLPHLNKCHSGPFIHYSLLDDTVTINLPTYACAIYINHKDHLYFLRWLSNTHHCCWLSSLCNSTKTCTTQFSIEAADENNRDESSLVLRPVSSLSQSSETILTQGNYFMIPTCTKELLIKIVR